MRKNVLFLCTGNLCRSPIAEGILKQKLAERKLNGIFVHSAGVRALEGESAAELAVEVSADHHVDLSSHVARQLTRQMLEEADLVIAMEPFHLDACRGIIRDKRNKCHLLSEFAKRKNEEAGIRDPYGCPVEVFAASYALIERLVEDLLDYLVEEWQLSVRGVDGGDGR